MSGHSFVNNGAYTDWLNTPPYPYGTYYWWGGDTRISPDEPGWSLDSDGIWHKWEIYVNYEYNYLRIWIDGEPYHENINPAINDGIIPVPEEFKMRGMQFFYTYRCFHVDSVSHVEGEYTDGWHIDDIEIYDGLIDEYTPYIPYCGDGMCDPTENTGSCESDCPYCEDLDGDHFSSTEDARCGTYLDCDDSDPDINPAERDCVDGIDNNCRDGDGDYCPD